MPVSKKMAVSSIYKLPTRSLLIFVQIKRQHKKDEEAGTRAPVKANGLPVKAAKPTSTVRVLRRMSPYHFGGSITCGAMLTLSLPVRFLQKGDRQHEHKAVGGPR